MWDETDYTARWVQGICAVPLLAWAGADSYLFCTGYWVGRSSVSSTAGESSGVIAAYVAYRCLRYALTGRNNINRDDY